MTEVAAVVVIVPVLRRPHRVAPLLEAFDEATTGKWRILFVCSDDDQEEQAAISTAGGEFITAGMWRPGDYSRKINLGIAKSDEPLIFLGADDIAPRPNWLENAVAHLHPGVGVVGTNDLGNWRVVRGWHATHSLLTRDYAQLGTIDDPNTVLHEGYAHNFCDDEFVATARFRKAFEFARYSVVEHLHKNWDKAPHDEVYRIGEKSFARDREHFHSREHLWG